jgi:serine/threonine protein kinase
VGLRNADRSAACLAAARELGVSSATNLDRIKGSDWELLNEQAERLEKAWRETSAPVDLRQFLPPAGSPLFQQVLHELIKTDLELRWRANHPKYLRDYLKEFPELGPATALPPTLIYEEYRARCLFGDNPDLDHYRDEFPDQFAQVQKLLKEYPLPLRYPKLASTLKDTVPSVAAPSLPPPVPEPPSASSKTDSISDHIVPNEGYALGKEIGSGEFGTVCRARAPGGVEVAIKRIHRPLSDKLSQRELKALELIRQLRHPYLLQTHTYWSLRDRLVIVMELADGSLSDWVEEHKKAGQDVIPLADLIRYFAEAAEALDFLHSHNVMHRDIKPANLLRLGGHAKVADFGLVRLQEERLEQATLFGGTALYLPPEGWRSQVSVHSDQYSLAVTYAEIRLGRRIFHGRTMPEIMQEHLTGSADLQGMDAKEQQVLRKALAKEPDARYPNCREFVKALSAAVLPSSSPTTSTHSPLLVWILSAAAMVLLSLLTVLGVKYYQRSQVVAQTAVVTENLPVLPPGFVKDDHPDTTVKEVYGRPRYTRIRYPIEGAEPLVLLLMDHTQSQNLLAFYISQDKVTRGQFNAVRQTPHFEELLKKYERRSKDEDRNTVRRKWTTKEWDKPEWMDSCPITNITATEAYCFAQCIGGQLPSANQWDKAGGRYDGALFPCNKKEWKPRGKLGAVGTYPADESMFHCRDMSGNGLEWVRNVFSIKDTPYLPFDDPESTDRVDCRGNSPRSREPVRFDMLRQHNQPYDAATQDISFRVVVEITQ